MKQKIRYVTLCLLALCPLQLAFAQAALKNQIKKFTLDNGLRVILVKQGSAPVINFNLSFDVGGIDEPPGLGGVAHMVEHMAFKGTRSIGSHNISSELLALSEVEEKAQALIMARKSGASERQLEPLQNKLQAAQARAQELAVPNALDALFTRNGAQGLNASTAYDRTSYVVSLPSNRLELYARVYADVLSNPVFRSFYEERDVVREERRQRSEDDPGGVLYEAFLRQAFKKSLYGRPLIGSAQEIAAYTETAAKAIFDTYYQPNRAVLVLVGDVNADRDMPVLRRYFDFVPRGPVVKNTLPAEPEQQAPRVAEVPFDAGPQLIIGYHKPTYPERGAYVADVLDYILGKGRSSRLYDSIVSRRRLASSISTSAATPGTRLPNLFTIEATPQAPHTAQQVEQEIYRQLTLIKRYGVRADELQTAKRLLRADVLRSLASGPALAEMLAYNELFAGGWAKLFDDLNTYDTVSAEEVQKFATATFVTHNRTVANLVTAKAPAAPSAEGTR